MDLGPTDPPDAAHRLSPSDPGLLQRACRWGPEYYLPTRKLSLEVEGHVGPSSWSELRARAAQALVECGLAVSLEVSPPFDEKVGLLSVVRLGYGYFVAENALRQANPGARWPVWSSFVTLVELQVDPPLPRGTVDGADLPHPWRARVTAGEVISVTRENRVEHYHREYSQSAPTDPGFQWIPNRVMDRLR